jgi:hypothetical protein
MFSNIENPLERGIAVFAYIARTQFFFDANKRTAMLLLNGILASSAIKPFFVPDSEKGKFSMVLTEFYESGNADNFMNFMADVACPDHEDNEQPAPC